MPNSLSHIRLTRAALALQPWALPDTDRFINDYCLYPDEYLSPRWREIAPYCPMVDNVPFHYLPDTPWDTLYRYWRMDADGSSRCIPFDNPNFRWAQAGFRQCISHAVSAFHAGQNDEAFRFLGVLLHVLQDATFGIHALEGAGGADLTILDRLLDAPVLPSELLANLQWEETMLLDYQPHSLGTTQDEAVMRLYAIYCQTASVARKHCVQYVQRALAGRKDDLTPLVRDMGEATIRLCADVLYTVHQLAGNERDAQPDPLRLETLEAFEYPFGGFGPFRFRPPTRDCVPDAAGGKPLPLQLGAIRYSHGLAFGSHREGRLLYWIAPGVFQSLTARIGLHPAFASKGVVDVTLVNNGQEVATLSLDHDHSEAPIMLSAPGDVTGLSFRSTPGCGVIVLASPELHRKVIPREETASVPERR